MSKPFVAVRSAIFLGFTGLLTGILHAAPLPVNALSAHYVSSTDSSGDYTDPVGNDIRFNTGDDNLLLVDSITVLGNRLIPSERADSIIANRVVSNSCTLDPGCNANGSNISGEKLFFQYPYAGLPLNHNLKPGRAYSLEDVYLSNAINIAFDNPLSNLDNNIERIDIIFTNGLDSPATVGERRLTGFMISERWGNNPHQIAAIRSLDNSGRPESFYRLSKGNINNYGNTQFTITHADGSVTGPAVFSPPSHRYKNQDAPVPGGVSGSRTNPLNGHPQYFLSTTQPVRSAFHSFEQLGIPAGVKIYGFSLFGVDVNQTMDLVGLSDVPLNTDHIIEDSADIFGSIGTLFVSGDQAIVGIAKEVTDQREIDTGVYEVDIQLVVENLSPDSDAKNVQVTDNLTASFEGAASFEIVGEPDVGRFTPPDTPYDGINQINLLSGTDNMPAGSSEIIRFTVRVDIGLSQGIYLNTAIATTANEPGGEPTGSDLSDEGSEPDSDGDGFPNGPGEDDPTAILLGPQAGRVSVDKTAGKTQVTVGDLVPYSLTVRNNTGRTMDNVEVQDTLPPGFKFVDDSAVLIRRGDDGQFGTADDISTSITPRGTSTRIFGPFALASQEIIRINYLLRVGAAVVPGVHENVAVPFLSDDPVGPSDVVSVNVIKDSAFDQSTVLGVVFHDRDRDGYQDSVMASNIRLQIQGIETLVDSSRLRFLVNEDQEIAGDLENGFTVNRIDGREYETRSSQLRQVQLRVPLKAGVSEQNLAAGRVIIESAEGTWLEGTVLGRERIEEKRGDVARGVNNQRLAYFTRLETVEHGTELVVTVVNDAIDEAGIAGVRLATVHGLVMETDEYGRYHLAEIDFIERGRGGQFIIKIDPNTLPEGAEFTTENPRLLRITSSVLNRINFGVHLPAQKIPETAIERTIPAHTELRDELNVDFSTYFLNEELDPVRFESGKSNIDEEYIEKLKPLIERMGGKDSVHLQATGHTDTVPLKPSTAEIYGDNQGLSEARAKAVADYIAQDGRLGEIEVATQGKSFREPVASNRTEEGRARNRRVEMQIVFDERIEKWVKAPVAVPEQRVIEKKPLIDGGSLWASEDPLHNDPRLDIQTGDVASIDLSGDLVEPLSFSTYTNYRYFIKRWQLHLFEPHDRSLSRPKIVAAGDTLTPGLQIKLSDLQRFDNLQPGQQLAYKLRVFDDEGHWDETQAKLITLVEENDHPAPLPDRQAISIFGNDSLRTQTIPIRGSRVRVYGAKVSDQYALALDGQTLDADGDGAFVSEQHMPIGQHRLPLTYTDKEGNTWRRDIDVDVKGNYLFMVGLANLTIGGNNASGEIENITENDQFNDDSFINGRGAFYLKGKIKGKYLITAQLDTREDEFENWDDQLKRKDRTTLFRELDPERYYPVYGDDSTTYSDVDTQGAYYVRVDWDKSRALWGNFNTDLTANEFAQYNRSLYGAQLVYRMPELTEYGEHKNLLSAFVSEAQSASGHNEFRATGGSLYYLRQTDIVTGSEKLWIEIREKDTTQVVERYPLRVGIDYDIDYFQGRIILSQPLSQIAQRMAPSIIQDQPLQGDTVFLLADYEYVPEDFSFDNVVGGLRGKTWLGDSVGIGATLVDEERDAEDYSLQGVDLTYQIAKGTYIKGEFAQSEASQATSGFVSNDGGLTFQTSPNQGALNREGEATGVELRLDLAELTDEKRVGEVKAWLKERDAGFSSSRDDNGLETRDRGLHARWLVNQKLQLSVRSKQLETGNTNDRSSFSAQIDGVISERLSGGIELQRSEESTAGAEDEDATLVGGKLNFRSTAYTNIYGKAQTVLSSTDAYQDNDQLALGVNSQMSERLSLGAEVIKGDRGDGLILGADYVVSEKANVNLAAGFGDGVDSQLGANYRLDNGLNLYGTYTRTTADNNEEKSTVTLGQRMKFANSLEIYAENQLSDTDRQAGLTHVFGVDYGLNDFVGLSFSLQKSAIEQEDAEDISRNAATAGLYYKRNRLKASTKLEYRRDRADLDTTQWLTTNAVEWKQSRDYRWLGRFNYSVTENDDTDINEATFTEASIGFAYRPALNDRFNFLSRLTYLYDLPSVGQDTISVDERSWVLALEGAYALTPRWELGAKLAGKKGEVRQQRDSGVWFDSTTRFYATRLRYHLPREWDALGEYRWLEQVEDETVRSGALVGLYKHLGEHIKLGVGFNFTDFNDDLTNLDYDNRGWFLDIAAKY